MTLQLGRHVFGIATLLLGVANLALHDQLTSNWQLPGAGVFLIVASAAQIAGGLAIQFRQSERLGAVILGCVYFVFALTWVPDIFAQPGMYYTWGNVFYRLASVAGGVIAYYMASPSAPRAKDVGKAAVVLLGLCNVSFAAEQLEFLSHTADLVPKWLPPSGMFWAVATTIAFVLAGVSLVSGYKALLASRLTALMFMIFGVAIWIPTLIADPKTHSNWSEGLETFAIGGAVWIVADFLGRAAWTGVSEPGALPLK
jgi:putative Ca2+/H+ antiporter (TMEM165/GDT1 family)